MTEEQEKQESQKTLVAFVAGLIIGGLLVWIFGGSPEHTEDMHDVSEDTAAMTADETMNNETTADDTMSSDDVVVITETPSTTTSGQLVVNDQPAGNAVALQSARFPTTDGWVGVRSYENGEIGNILGAARYSESQGLIPQAIELLVPTVAGKTYAVVFFNSDGNRTFSAATDTQIEGGMTTFVAQ